MSISKRGITKNKDFVQKDNSSLNHVNITKEGSNISLDNTRESEIDLIYKGQIEQEQTEGYQLLNLVDGTYTNAGITAVVDNGTITLNGTATSNAFVAITSNADIGWTIGKYTIIANNPVANANVRLRVNSGGGLDTILDSVNKVGIINYTGNSDIQNYRITVRVQSGTTLTNYTIKPMLEVGETVHEYEKYTGKAPSPSPSYKQDIQVVTGTQEILIRGKNFLDFSALEHLSGTTLIGITREIYDNTIRLNGTSSSNGPIIATSGQNLGTILTARTYTYSVRIKDGTITRVNPKDIAFILYDTDDQVIVQRTLSQVQQNANTIQFTLTETKRIKSFYIYCNAEGVAFDNVELTFQVEPGTQATEFEKHQEQTKTLHLGDKEYVNIGDYADYIFQAIKGDEHYDSLSEERKNDLTYDKWYVEKNILKYVFNGSENWSTQSGRYNTETRMMFATQLADTFPAGMFNRKAFCNYFIDYAHDRPQTVQSDVDITAFNFHWNSQYSHFIYVKIDRSVLPAETEAGMKQWVLNKYQSGNPMVIYAQIQTSIYEEITDETLLNELNELEKIMSYNEQTNISVEGDLPLIIKATTSSIYKKLEYIKGTGSQYINIEYIPKTNTKIVLDFESTDTGTGKWLIGSRTAYQSTDSLGIHWGNSNTYSIVSPASRDISTNTSGRHLLELTNTTFKVDDITKLTYSNTLVNGTYPMYIFTMNSGGAIDGRIGIGNLYSCKIYEDNTLVRDLIPVMRTTDNTIGLYDNITETFYKNIGTGSFTGKELNLASRIDSNNILYANDFYEV